MSELPEVLGVCLNTHGGVEEFMDSFQHDPVVYIRRDAITPAMAAEVLLGGLDNRWDKSLSADTNSARQKAERDGHKYSVIDREGFRAALLAIAKDKS